MTQVTQLMPKNVSFNVRLEDDPSKADEIALIEKMGESFRGSHTYLASLWSESFEGWLINRIKEDWELDIWTLAKGREAEYRDSVQELAASEEAKKIIQDELVHVTAARKVDAETAEAAYLTLNLASKEQIDSLRQLVRDTNAALVLVERQAALTSDSLAKCENELNATDDELVRVKALLFDLSEVEKGE